MYDGKMKKWKDNLFWMKLRHHLSRKLPLTLAMLDRSEYTRNQRSISLTHHFTSFTITTPPVLEMAQSSNPSNVVVHGSTFNSVQGDFHVHNEDSESGMHDFRSEEHPYQ